jgi:hypothetical protein
MYRVIFVASWFARPLWVNGAASVDRAGGQDSVGENDRRAGAVLVAEECRIVVTVAHNTHIRPAADIIFNAAGARAIQPHNDVVGIDFGSASTPEKPAAARDDGASAAIGRGVARSCTLLRLRKSKACATLFTAHPRDNGAQQTNCVGILGAVGGNCVVEIEANAGRWAGQEPTLKPLRRIFGAPDCRQEKGSSAVKYSAAQNDYAYALGIECASRRAHSRALAAGVSKFPQFPCQFLFSFWSSMADDASVSIIQYTRT